MPLDLLIFPPSSSSQPWPNTFLGSGRSSAMSMAGQMIVWKRMISLPTKCTSAGPELFKLVILVVAVAERGDVVGQRVDPHVDDVAGVEGDGDAP